MQAAGVTNERDIRLFRERRLQVPKDADPIFALDIAIGVNLQSGRNHLGEPSDTVGEYLDIVAEQRAQISQMALSDAAKSDDQYLHRFAPNAKSRRLQLAQHKFPIMPNPGKLFSSFAARNLHDEVSLVSDPEEFGKQNRNLRIARSKRNRPTAAYPVFYMYAADSVAIGRNLFAQIVAKRSAVSGIVVHLQLRMWQLGQQ